MDQPAFMSHYPYTALASTVHPGPEHDKLYVNASWCPKKGVRIWGFTTSEDRRQFCINNPEATSL
jgi:hypothetical protein